MSEKVRRTELQASVFEAYTFRYGHGAGPHGSGELELAAYGRGTRVCNLFLVTICDILTIV